MPDKDKKDERPESTLNTEREKDPGKETDAEKQGAEKLKTEEADNKPEEIPEAETPPETEPQSEPDTPPPPQSDEAPETVEEPAPTNNLAEELAQARAQIAAYKSGMRPDVVDDAVYLAMRDVKKSGEDVNEETIAKALKGVIKRHPEWKNSGKDAQQNGFRVGAEPQDEPTGNEDIAKAFGNK